MHWFNSMMKYDNLMGSILSSGNLRVAYGRVMSNRGSAGIDGMQVDDLHAYLKDHLGSLKQTLLAGVYTPHPVLGRDTQGPRRCSSIGDTDGGRSDDTAGHTPNS